jgi:hypothetical protein
MFGITELRAFRYINRILDSINMRATNPWQGTHSGPTTRMMPKRKLTKNERYIADRKLIYHGKR